ncbi:MAG: nuclear transport factor 2 family protein [Acidaminococcaceae bacterium]|nr:nuclear transport factor 2 family protein [Acidaminococcaceae bacterium]
MRSTAENQIKIISRKIMHTIFVENRLDYVFSLLAPDVYYLGSGKNMQAEGKKKFEFFLSKAYANPFSCTILQEKYLTKRIGWDHWLCEVIVDMAVGSSGAEPIPECRHETFLFRRCKDAKQGEWELVHIHTSVANNRVSPEEMLAIQQANRTRRNTHLYDGLTEREKKLVQMLRSGMQIRDIAAGFGLAEITIKKALAKLYHRYNVKNRSRLCAYFDAQENNF